MLKQSVNICESCCVQAFSQKSHNKDRQDAYLHGISLISRLRHQQWVQNYSSSSFVPVGAVVEAVMWAPCDSHYIEELVMFRCQPGCPRASIRNSGLQLFTSASNVNNWQTDCIKNCSHMHGNPQKLYSHRAVYSPLCMW